MRASLAACFVLPWLALGAPCRAADAPFAEAQGPVTAPAGMSDNGRIALAIRPQAWLRGESAHFIIYYRRITEAKRVATEIEYHIAFIAKTLGAGPERYARKSNVFIFEDENDWKTFLSQTPIPPWAASFALGDELFLNIRQGRTGLFDSQTLAHETTHAVVARLYPGERWPLWLSEGFAEQMSGLSVAARMGQYDQRLLHRFQMANMPLDQLTTLSTYPADAVEVARLYQSAEKLVRFLMNNNPADRFPRLVDLLAAGEPLETAIPKIYGDRYPDYAAFTKAYDRLPK